MMLPSGPDMVHSKTKFKTLISTQGKMLVPTNKNSLKQLVQPCYSGLQVQGTASSPPSAAKVIYHILNKKSNVFKFCY